MCVERDIHTSDITTLTKRYLSTELYSKSLPWLSPSQGLVCMPRSFAFGGENELQKEDEVIDVYDCADLEFWMSSLVLDTTDPRFKCSLDLGETECHSFRQGCRQVVFSQTCKYIGVLCERKLIVFDIEQANS